MIPWRLKYSGIRDYPPTQLDLSGANEHVLITGPNGSGKSTITFCMGAVLYSAKVDVEGLKSRNLAPDHTWKATISLLFKNEGKMKIDAKDFLEFTLKIVQEPGQPMKKEFHISKGDRIDEWEETVRYTSGDRVLNFSAYKKDLQYKYKVDPDLFYLIWYQQEVNQFAVMHPEERFRIFSEMHGIDKVQRDWEESMERVKETEETVRAAETNVKFMKQELQMKKVALDHYLDNQKRLNSGGKLYLASLFQLENHYKKEIDRLEDVLQQLSEDIQEAQDDMNLKKSLQEKENDQLLQYKANYDELEAKITIQGKVVQKTSGELKLIEQNIRDLDKELESIVAKKNQIVKTEEEVKLELEKLQTEQKKTCEQIKENEQLLTNLNKTWQEKVETIAALKHQVKEDARLEKEHRERLSQYVSSHAIQEKIDLFDKRIKENKDQLYYQKNVQEKLTAEQKMLLEGKNTSTRQMESLQYFRSKGINAYTLQELIELTDDAQLKDEQRFNSIKYTVFFDGKFVTPPNDLYHVPLMTIVPDRSVTKLPELHLKVKERLFENELPYAIKALWWVEQFFKEGAFSIKNGVLIDPIGLRGQQEKERYILSFKALKLRREEIEQQLNGLAESISELTTTISEDTKTIQELNSIIHGVRESEAFMISEHERVIRKRKLENEIKLQAENEEERKRLQEKERTLIGRQIRQEHSKKILDEEAEVYRELGKLKDKYEERTLLQKKQDLEKSALLNHKALLDGYHDELEEVDKKISKTDRTIRKIKESIEDAERNIKQIEKQQTNHSDDLDAAKNELVQIIKELEDLKQLVPTLYTETAEAVSFEGLPSVSQLKQNCENGKITFDGARTEKEIDPAAPENYETVKKEFERLDSEYHRFTILLDQDKERMANLQDQLETTINMRVLELQRRFKMYMSQFQFEGDITWDSYEDKKKRTHFSLYIKARKEGHRGTLEDVSTKARGGKVGKGVSGGEESLSSLLFALALLQNLQTTPGFIVLDEFDSALDEVRKVKVFDLYEQELKRKLIILTPKSHEDEYLGRFNKAFIVRHNPTIPESKVVGIVKKKQEHQV
ncbi:SMC family protein [Schinkia azotoformans]|uniref:chromosome segregation protein SMC n=1 Tax=Schinkia azotoformans TaxID=1454 RepID=UPI002DB61223|nr:chromosome segregation protein SMC [Schinkia azotoformans]MEC1717677.1 chromosome segregation protein SMC [Schinkia azotoformans]MEC1747790.1 chromosome segregation protein SMC [Schinkia azotoformans]MEC1760434.1 chromosome segregation protein SMC [Schinkia azotoformans]MED4378367.1 chromosome segregation protein SMC [Schinkia azotoformans]